ncbi:MAG: hypothetical protein K2Z80_10385 [Xanthobacteraceae bacterium]|nr:hypothetical protein [Xanthobacteraceae bacterium]
MSRLALLLAAAATAAVAASISPAEARDGCGRGWYYNGYRCVPAHGGGYRGHGYRDPGSYYAPNFRGNVVRPVMGDNGAISCSNPNYTWQDGACKPYRGRRGW